MVGNHRQNSSKLSFNGSCTIVSTTFFQGQSKFYKKLNANEWNSLKSSWQLNWLFLIHWRHIGDYVITSCLSDIGFKPLSRRVQNRIQYGDKETDNIIVKTD